MALMKWIQLRLAAGQHRTTNRLAAIPKSSEPEAHRSDPPRPESTHRRRQSIVHRSVLPLVLLALYVAPCVGAGVAGNKVHKIGRANGCQHYIEAVFGSTSTPIRSAGSATTRKSGVLLKPMIRGWWKSTGVTW
jgi:hypothetical protein